MNEFTPVATLPELDASDQGQMVEGYFEGRDNEPEPGHNRGKSFWHGWRNGMMDAGHMDIDEPARRLVHEYVKRGIL